MQFVNSKVGSPNNFHSHFIDDSNKFEQFTTAHIRPPSEGNNVENVKE